MFAPYIIGLKVLVETDHAALVSMFNNAKECGSTRVNKWAMEISSRFDVKVQYKEGKSNENADALSRAIPVVTTCSAQAGEPLEVDPRSKIASIPNRENWISEQAKGDFADVYDYIRNRKLPREPERVKLCLDSASRFTIIDQCLFYIDPESAALRLVVPESQQRRVFHDMEGCSALI